MVAAIALVVSTILPSCKSTEARDDKEVKDVEIRTSDDNVKNNENAVVNDAKMEKERTEYRFEQEKKIRENDDRIKEYEAKMDNVGKNMREEYRQRVKDLKEKNETMKNRMNDYKYDTESNWQEFKREFNHDMDELGKSIRDFGRDNTK
jgi:hypothetical protein